MAEMSVAIIVVSMPALKYLLTSWKKLSGSGDGNESSGYYNSTYDGQRSGRRQNQISCAALGDETGSDVELNRVMREDVIVKTKEVSVDSRPAKSSGSFNFGNQSWGKEGRDERIPSR